MGLNILLVDDEQDVRQSLSHFLTKLGHRIVAAADAEQALGHFQGQAFDVVVSDIRMPGMDGLELLQRLRQSEGGAVEVILVTGHGDMDNAVKALKLGAFDYLQKPIDVRELALGLDRIQEYKTLRNNYSQLKQEFNHRVAESTQALRSEAERLRQAYLQEVGLGQMCVFSDHTRAVLDLAKKYSRDRSLSLLIEGESGTGKELIARFVHYYQAEDPLKPFVAVNCGAISPQLFEGEFFGHRPGAFTGASSAGQKGKLEAAHGGAIFLDEIGEMPLELQIKLLRVLEERRFYPLGGIKEVPVDLRVICATNKNLAREVDEGRFRADLYYRISIGVVRIPPLRERPEEVVPLARHFVQRAAARQGREFGRFAPSAEEALTRHPWPGNVRQVKNLMERLALLGPWDRVQAEDLARLEDVHAIPAPVAVCAARPAAGAAPGLDPAAELPPEGLDLERLNQRIIRAALEMHQGNQTRTAQYLGLSRRALQGRLQKMGL